MSRAVRDNSKAVSLFPFLAVLLCTMGALLVLLVVLAEQASRVVATAESEPKPQEAAAAKPVEIATPQPQRVRPQRVEPHELPAISELEKLRARRKVQLEEQAAIEKRLSEERAKLAHLEEHARRLEHAVSELYLNNLQLEATEEDQELDHEQAKRELARLEQLVEESREQLEEMQKEAKQPKSYAIVPYRGPNGTFRPPVFIECTENAVLIQPGGTRLTEKDFMPPIRSGNALAAALRATENHYQQQAVQTGAEPLEPYPLVIVRPSGHEFYAKVLAALKVADISYGYEFLAEKKRIEYAAANPILANQQDHAVQFARLQQERLAKAAPRRFTTRVGTGSGSREGGGYGSSVGGDTNGNSSDRYAASGQGRDSYGSGTSDLLSSGTSGEMGSDFAQQGDSRLGASGDSAAASGGPDSGAGATGSATGSWENSDSIAGSTGQTSEGAEDGAGGHSISGGEGVPGGMQTAGSTAGSAAGQAGGAAGAGSTNSGSQGTTSSGASSGAVQAGSVDSQSQSVSATFSSSNEVHSAAQGRGSDWALQKSRSQSVPMRRPISVYVRNEGLELLPSPEKQSFATSKFISFDQPTNKMLDEFAQSIRERTNDWGLAGRSMHWKPVLRLKIAPGADRQANKLARLLEGSGVDVELPLTAVRSQGGDANVTR